MFEQNQMVDVNQLAALNEQLRKNAESIKKSAVGYQSFSAGDGSLSPIVPQSIEQTLVNASFAMKDIVAWNMIPKVSVTNSYHEYAVINDHGQNLDPFIAEGGGASSDFGTTNAQYERKFVKIKYLAERRSISDVGTLVGILGNNPNGLAEETERGTMSLLRKVENQMFHGSELVNSLGFDGLIEQIARDTSSSYSEAAGGRTLSTNQSNLAGAELTPEYLHQVLGELSGLERFGKSDFIMCDPKVYSKLIKQSSQNGRHDSMMLVNMLDQGIQTFGAGPKIHIMGPFGPVPVVMAPFLNNQSAPPSAKSADGITLAAGDFALSAVAQASSFDAAGDAAGHDGTFKYKIVAVSSKGYSNALDCGAGVALDDSKVARITISAAGATACTAGDIQYFKIYRSAVGLDADYKLVAEVPAAQWKVGNVSTGAFANGEKWDDYGTTKRDTSSVIVGQTDTLEFARLLDFIRRPVAELGAAKNFLLMLFGSVAVKAPKKNWVIRNCDGKISL
jgi:hypothetical protein